MSTPKDGGPAFAGQVGPSGMSLRDYFAGQALAGMCAHPDGLHLITAEALREDANLAYALADAMLAARKRKGDNHACAPRYSTTFQV